jgi:hypothetical protein
MTPSVPFARKAENSYENCVDQLQPEEAFLRFSLFSFPAAPVRERGKSH